MSTLTGDRSVTHGDRSSSQSVTAQASVSAALTRRVTDVTDFYTQVVYARRREFLKHRSPSVICHHAHTQSHNTPQQEIHG